MIGHVIMEIEREEICAALAFYLNSDVFCNNGRGRIPVTVTDVRERKSNGSFIVEFDGVIPTDRSAGTATGGSSE